MTNDDIIARGLAIRAEITVIKARHTAELIEYETALETIENYLLDAMIQRRETNIKTSKGTAYQAESLRVSMEDRDALLTHAIEEGDYGFFTNHVAKEHVKEYMETHQGLAPPGVKVERSVVCHLRKP